MVTIKARVHGGRFIVDELTDLPEGTEVELAPVLDDDLDDESRAALEASLARSGLQVQHGQLVDADTVLRRMGLLTP